MPALQRQCLACGMRVPALRFDFDAVPPQLRCPKCDASLYLQGDGSCLTRDIAHSHETVLKALDKLDATLLSAWQGYCSTVRLIVGGGLIREQVLGQLQHRLGRGQIRAFREESPNKGAILVTLRKDACQ
jgi:hypothetical protein